MAFKAELKIVLLQLISMNRIMAICDHCNTKLTLEECLNEICHECNMNVYYRKSNPKYYSTLTTQESGTCRV